MLGISIKFVILRKFLQTKGLTEFQKRPKSKSLLETFLTSGCCKCLVCKYHLHFFYKNHIR